MVKKMALAFGALALAFGGSALVASAAQADSSAKTSGARVTVTSDGEVFRLYDEKCDSCTVYLVYKLRGGSEQRIEFSGGCNKSASATRTSPKAPRSSTRPA